MMERENRWLLTGFIQVDDAYRGGEYHGGSRGRGSENKTPFIAAIQTDKGGYPQFMCFSAIDGFRRSEIKHWAEHVINLGSG